MTTHDIRIDSITIGTRFRKDLGDLESLARSIAEAGLLQPIGVTSQNELVFGERRLLACRDHLHWDEIPARVIDLPSIAHGESCENCDRKDYTPSELVAIVDSLRDFGHGGDRRSNQARNSDDGRLTVAQAADRVG